MADHDDPYQRSRRTGRGAPMRDEVWGDGPREYRPPPRGRRGPPGGDYDGAPGVEDGYSGPGYDAPRDYRDPADRRSPPRDPRATPEGEARYAPERAPDHGHARVSDQARDRRDMYRPNALDGPATSTYERLAPGPADRAPVSRAAPPEPETMAAGLARLFQMLIGILFVLTCLGGGVAGGAFGYGFGQSRVLGLGAQEPVMLAAAGAVIGLVTGFVMAVLVFGGLMLLFDVHAQLRAIREDLRIVRTRF